MNMIPMQDDEELIARTEFEAERLVSKYPNLTLWPLLARLLNKMCAVTATAPQTTPIAGGSQSDTAITLCHTLYIEMYCAVQEFMTYHDEPYAALIRIADTNPHFFPSQLGTAFFAITASPPRNVPLTRFAVQLRDHVDALVRYLHLVLNRLPELRDPAAANPYRAFINEIVQLTGWTATTDEITEACAVAMLGDARAGVKDRGFDLTRAERAAIKAWHAEHGFS